jgi:hypothetical protein
MASSPIKPAHEIRIGRVKATVWANLTDDGIRHNVKVACLYKNEQGWQTTNSFGRDDIPLLIKVLVRAHDWMYETSESQIQAPEPSSE